MPGGIVGGNEQSEDPEVATRRRFMTASLVVGVVLVAVASAGAIARFSAPYLWVYGGWLAFCGVAMVRSPRKALWFNLAAPIAVLFGLESWAARPAVLSSEGSRTEGYIVPDDVLGYAPTPSYVAHQRRSTDGELVYEVDYTIDARGLRLAPPGPPDPGAECVLFFGGSFTFGEGLADDETLPFQTGIASGGRYRVYNFGFHGYGPHQMLAALEEGVVDDAIDCRPRYLFYQSIHDHVGRAAGLRHWDRHGPRYVLNADGVAERRGHFDDGRRVGPAWLGAALAKSKLFTRVAQWHREVNHADYALFIGILDATRRFADSHYPGCEFHILHWDKARRSLAGDLEERGFRVHRVTEILPDRAQDRLRYQIHALDRHPNARAFHAIARYLSREVLDPARFPE